MGSAVRLGNLKIPIVLTGMTLVILIGVVVVFGRAGTGPQERPLVDLGIGNTPGLGQPGITAMNESPSRPAILVAWRNTKQILEIESLITNKGSRAGRGELSVDILDATHERLAHQPPESEPFVVSVPPARAGGVPGITVQIPGTYQLNSMLDGLDRSKDPYCLRVTVRTLGEPDANLLDNTQVKCYNSSARLVANGTAFQQYYLRNSTDAPVSGNIVMASPEIPQGWILDAQPEPGTEIYLRPGEFVIGALTIGAPTEVEDGDYVDLRPMLVDVAGNVIDATEFYVASDSSPPRITDAVIGPGRNSKSVYVVLRAVDRGSGIAEASGATVEWSTDAGFTKNTRVLTYQDGNFLSPTGFDTDLGPFAKGTRVTLTLTVHDVVDNAVRTEEVSFRIPLRRTIEVGL